MFYADYDVDIAVTVNEPLVDEYEAGEDKYDDTLENTVLQPGTIVWDIGGEAINNVKDLLKTHKENNNFSIRRRPSN